MPTASTATPNQSDANILAVLDLRNKEMTLISVSRDAMCTLDILDSAGEHVARLRRSWRLPTPTATGRSAL